jgi:hypothetical protein
MARGILEIYLKIRGASCKYVGCGLILEKMRGLSAKCRVLWTAPARYTMDRRPLLRTGANRSSASGRSDARELRPKGGGGEGRVGELNDGVTASREVVEGHLTGAGALAWMGGGQGTARAQPWLGWESSPRAGRPFIGRRRGEGGRVPSMAGVEGASMPPDSRRWLPGIEEEEGCCLMGK